VTAQIQLSRTSAPARTAEHTPRRRLPVVRTVLLVIVALVFAIPLIWMVLAAFKPTAEIISETVPLTWKTFLPVHATFDNFISIFTQYGFGTNLRNSAIVTVLQVAGSILTSVLAGYGFARMRFRGNNVLFVFCLACAFVPMEAIILPEYRLVLAIGLNNTFAGAILPFMFSPFGIFLMRQAFRELPDEMFEAATVDGAGAWRTMLRVAIPNIGPSFVTLVLVQFIWSWNAYVWPLIVLQDPSMQTAQVAIANFQSVPNHPMNGEMMAASASVTIPLIVLALLLQRYYVRGLVMSGNK
jgi:ABC-type glycerol-3-phosphate transport system permease component